MFLPSGSALISRPRLPEEAMPSSLVRVNGAEVALEGSGQTIVNVNLRQESSFAYLCRGVAALSRPKAADKGQDAGGIPPARPRWRGEQKVLGGAQILLGAVCISLGLVLVLSLSMGVGGYYMDIRWSGAPFWMGSLFILSGTFSVVGERRGGKWVHLATFLNLASVVAGSVALVAGVAQIPSLQYKPSFIEDVCKHQEREQRRYPYWGTTAPPVPINERDQERARRCQEVLWMFVSMATGVRILLLLFSIAGLCVALFCLGYGLRVLCCSCWAGWQDYVALGEAEGPAPLEEPGKEENLA